MHLVLSGEGNSDLGLFCQYNNEFIAGSMYFIVDKIIEQKYDFSYYDVKDEMITFIPKVELTKLTKRLPPFTGKKGLKGTAYFTNNAIALARIAKKKSNELNEEVIAILFRDSDGTSSTIKGMWEDKVESIENGFKIEKFDSGVAMIPKPKSEAWLICALKDKAYENCQILENRSGNDKSPNNLKDELKSLGIELDSINEMIKDGRIDIEKIDMPSFKYFTNQLKELL
ncbi:MAG: Unknown protein [uncultured Sulfurovum sp.]|uniref:Uncharacterized protein n=1 Tax=uncultured Sulfurovum sp. TaxID=269237 RepID=A0A6S6SP03_9BACT|nr:MAG: Unknown protein [uncultured Sulfurovum sp.]